MLQPETFVPLDRRHALTQQTALPDRAVGSTLFADISGFSKLTARLLDMHGDGGAEAVLKYINPLYDAIISELHRYGGSVIGFAGDSITCWLDRDSGLQAVACALAMQQAIAAQPPIDLGQDEPFTLGLKVAVAAGPVRRFQVGLASHRYLDVLAGETLSVMAHGEKLAEPGDVIVSAETMQQLQGQVHADVWLAERRFARVSRLNVAVDRLDVSAEIPTPSNATDWMLKPVVERLKTGDYLAELRNASALFLRFGGIEIDTDDQAGEKLDRFICWVETILERSHGYLLQLSFGDKGSYLYASFGAPRASSDNALNALNAGRALLHAPSEFDFIEQVQVGISQGRMWTGAYGGRQRSTYGVLGHHANMAARLMSNAAAGELLIDATMTKAAAAKFELEPLDSILVKGHDGPMPIWSIHAAPHIAWALPEFSTPLFGRDAALAQLGEAWQRTEAGKGECIGVLGDAGIGKSHLSLAFVNQVLAKGGQVAWGAGDFSAQETVYNVWRRLLETILQLDESGSDDLLGLLKTRLRPLKLGSDNRLPLLGDLLGTELADNATTAAFEPQIRREALFALTSDLLAAAAARQPLLLVIDDAHWVDDISAELIRHVVRQLADQPIMLLLLRRPEGVDWSDDVDDSITLNPLTQTDIANISATRLAAAVSPLLDDLLGKLTGGNPFFIETLLSAMQTAEQIVWQNDSWRLSDAVRLQLHEANLMALQNGEWRLLDSADLSTAQLGLPDSIRHTVLARIDQLEEESKLALKVASVIGLEFAQSLLQQSHPTGLDDASMDRDLDYLGNEGLITTLQLQLYRFRHQATQEVAYNTLLFSQRQTLHQHVANALQQLEPEAIGALAHHAFEGQLWALALRAHLAVGQRAQRLYANHQSVVSYTKALTCLAHLDMPEPDETAQQVQLSLGESLLHLGRYDEARARLEPLAASDKVAYSVPAHRWIGRSYELQGNYAEAMAWFERGRARDVAGSRESAEMLAISGLIETRRGNFDAAEALCTETLQMTDTLDAPSIRGRIFNLLGIIYRLRGEGERSLKQFTRALATYRNCSDLRGEALALNQLAVANAEFGSWQKAVTHYEQARRIFLQTGDTYNRLLVDNNLGNIARDQGRLDDALLAYQSAIAALQQVGGSPYVQGALHLNLGATFTLRGELDEAQRELAQSESLFISAEVRDLLPELHRYQALAQLQAGDHIAATTTAQLSLSVARELTMRVEEGHALMILGTLAQQSDDSRAEGQLVKALAIFDETGDPYGLGKAHMQLGRYYLDQQKPEQSQIQLWAARDSFAKLNAMRDLNEAETMLMAISAD